MKKKCELAIKLNAFLDGELDTEETATIKYHLTQCPYCQKHLRELKKLNQFISSHQEKEVSADLTAKLLEIGKRRSIISTRIPLKFSRFAVAASLVIAFIASVIFVDLSIKTKSNLSYSYEEDSFYSYFEGENGS